MLSSRVQFDDDDEREKKKKKKEKKSSPIVSYGPSLGYEAGRVNEFSMFSLVMDGRMNADFDVLFSRQQQMRVYRRNTCLTASLPPFLTFLSFFP